MKKIRIIVAEDNADMREALVYILRGDFKIVAAVEDGRSLIDAAISLLPDVIVSDISMPRLTGPEAMQELSARGHNTPFVFVSSSPGFAGPCTCSFVSKANACFELVAAVHAVAPMKKSRVRSQKVPQA